MKKEIRHRRLHAFYQSKVLNVLEMVIIMCISMIGLFKTLLIPALCGGIATALFAVYALWIWIKKPKQLIINKYIAETSSVMMLYLLFITAFKAESLWWYLPPCICAAWALLMMLVKPESDEHFIIAD